MQMQQFPLANNEAKKRKNRTAPSANENKTMTRWGQRKELWYID